MAKLHQAIVNKVLDLLPYFPTGDDYYTWKDRLYKKDWVQGTEFLRRFCLHVLPPYFKKVRHYGFCANAIKAKSIATAKIAFGLKIKALLDRKERKELAKERLFGEKTDLCPCCKKGKIKLLIGIVGCRDPPRNDNVIFRAMPNDQQIEASFKDNDKEEEI